jgi:hypothetical protein
MNASIRSFPFTTARILLAMNGIDKYTGSTCCAGPIHLKRVDGLYFYRSTFNFANKEEGLLDYFLLCQNVLLLTKVLKYQTL